MTPDARRRPRHRRRAPRAARSRSRRRPPTSSPTSATSATTRTTRPRHARASWRSRSSRASPRRSRAATRRRSATRAICCRASSPITTAAARRSSRWPRSRRSSARPSSRAVTSRPPRASSPIASTCRALEKAAALALELGGREAFAGSPIHTLLEQSRARLKPLDEPLRRAELRRPRRRRCARLSSRTSTLRTLAPEEMLVTEGEPSRNVFVVKSGLLGVWLEKPSGGSWLVRCCFPGLAPRRVERARRRRRALHGVAPRRARQRGLDPARRRRCARSWTRTSRSACASPRPSRCTASTPSSRCTRRWASSTCRSATRCSRASSGSRRSTTETILLPGERDPRASRASSRAASIALFEDGQAATPVAVIEPDSFYGVRDAIHQIAPSVDGHRARRDDGGVLRRRRACRSSASEAPSTSSRCSSGSADVRALRVEDGGVRLAHVPEPRGDGEAVVACACRASATPTSRSRAATPDFAARSGTSSSASSRKPAADARARHARRRRDQRRLRRVRALRARRSASLHDAHGARHRRARRRARRSACACRRATCSRCPDAITDVQAVFVEPLAAACGVLERCPIDAGVARRGDRRRQARAALRDGARRARRTRRCSSASTPRSSRSPARAASRRRPIDERAQRGRAFDVVVEASGAAQRASSSRSTCSRPQGTLVLKSTFHGATPIDAARVVVDEIHVIGSRCGRFAPALELLARGAVDVDAARERGAAARSRPSTR